MEFVLRCEMPVYVVIRKELLGSKHHFRSRGRVITVELPNRYYSKREPQTDIADKQIAYDSGGTEDECFELTVNLLFVTVEVKRDDPFKFTADMAFSHEASSLFWERNEQSVFYPASEALSAIATDAFDYWCRTLRWRSGTSAFGLPVVRPEERPGWRYFASVEPLNYVTGLTHHLRLDFCDAVDIELWNNIQEHLHSGLQPPFWIDAYHDANRRFASGDYRGALLEAVVAIEAFIRAELLSAVPPDETAIRKRLNLWAMTDVLDNFTKIGALRALGIPAETLKKIKEAFKIRNEIMHGKTVILKEDFLTETLSSAKMVVRA